MRSKRTLLLVLMELVFAVAFVTASALVFLYKNDNMWVQVLLVLGGIAGLLNGAYLLKLRSKPPVRRRPGGPKR
ncbi:hypothetical protein ACFFNY_14260 [Paenibacillus hodogayensis]|uniref:Uncharacterized protein n=1 Tax=Paenibacillus hodogayensis TaxID=279208 RepID=A0ABV5VWS7_9BACL